jgi:hypothetical protein
MEVEAAMELQRHLDETGAHCAPSLHHLCLSIYWVWTKFDQDLLLEKSLPNVNFLTFLFTPSLHGLH